MKFAQISPKFCINLGKFCLNLTKFAQIFPENISQGMQPHPLHPQDPSSFGTARGESIPVDLPNIFYPNILKYY